jgi:hypothetical protein
MRYPGEGTLVAGNFKDVLRVTLLYASEECRLRFHFDLVQAVWRMSPGHLLRIQSVEEILGRRARRMLAGALRKDAMRKSDLDGFQF